MIFTVSYGRRIDSLDSKIIQKKLELVKYSISLMAPGRFWADTFPILKYVPDILAPAKKAIKDKGLEDAKFHMALMEGVKADLQAAQNQSNANQEAQNDSLSMKLLGIKEKENISFSDRDFAQIPGSIFGAGYDSTTASILSAVLGLLTSPLAFKAAQAEIDSLVGIDRIPRFSDEPQLPYICVLVKETLRWRPVVALGLPHASIEDDRYQGFHIPTGTTITTNVWAMNLNEEYYPSPITFDPARFALHLKGKAYPSKLGHSSFGWGRRICPGAALAVNVLFITMAKLIWAFEILPVEGSVYDTFVFVGRGIIRPRELECRFKIRSNAHREVLEREMLDAEKEMEKYPSVE